MNKKKKKIEERKEKNYLSTDVLREEQTLNFPMQFYNSVYVHLLRVLLRGHSCLTREYSQLFVKVP